MLPTIPNAVEQYLFGIKIMIPSEQRSPRSPPGHWHEIIWGMRPPGNRTYYIWNGTTVTARFADDQGVFNNHPNSYEIFTYMIEVEARLHSSADFDYTSIDLSLFHALLDP